MLDFHDYFSSRSPGIPKPRSFHIRAIGILWAATTIVNRFM
jgi:hypothetical protein